MFIKYFVMCVQYLVMRVLLSYNVCALSCGDVHVCALSCGDVHVYPINLQCICNILLCMLNIWNILLCMFSILWCIPVFYNHIWTKWQSDVVSSCDTSTCIKYHFIAILVLDIRVMLVRDATLFVLHMQKVSVTRYAQNK